MRDEDSVVKDRVSGCRARETVQCQEVSLKSRERERPEWKRKRQRGSCEWRKVPLSKVRGNGSRLWIG